MEGSRLAARVSRIVSDAAGNTCWTLPTDTVDAGQSTAWRNSVAISWTAPSRGSASSPGTDNSTRPRGCAMTRVPRAASADSGSPSSCTASRRCAPADPAMRARADSCARSACSSVLGSRDARSINSRCIVGSLVVPLGPECELREDLQPLTRTPRGSYSGPRCNAHATRSLATSNSYVPDVSIASSTPSALRT